MKQVTGNKITRDSALESILSIRLSPDGFYFRVIRHGKTIDRGCYIFSEEAAKSTSEKTRAVDEAGKPTGLAGYLEENELFSWKFLRVKFLVDTFKVVLFPEDENIDPNNLFKDSGIPVSEHETMVISESINEIKAAVAVDKDIYDLFIGFFDNMEVLHPLLGLTGHIARKTLRLYTTRRNLYMALLLEGRLNRVEAIPYNNLEDISYCIGHLLSGGGRRIRIQLFGKDNSKFGRQIEKKFSAKYKMGNIPEWLW